jgi:TetR/AcrR family transcriptional regulator, transcriptional repressor of bet genes
MRIIEATVASVAAEGAAGASLRSIVRHAEVTKGLVSYHFGSRANLLVAAFERLCDDYREMLGIVAGRPPQLADDVEQQLRETIQRCFDPRDYSERQYAYFGFWALARRQPELRAVNEKMNDEAAAYLGELLVTIAHKRGRTIDGLAAGHELSATIDGAWLHLTTEVDSFTPAQAVVMCLECAERLVERDWGALASGRRDARSR